MAATVLAALHTFLNYAERAAAHRHAAARYGSLRRELEEARAAPGDWDAVRAVVRNWNQLDEAAPDVPERLHACALQTVAARSPKPSFE